MSNKPRLLWCGDAAVASGFARVTHNVLDVTRHTWDVFVLGLNYTGDPHDYPYKIYPPDFRSPWGLSRVKPLIESLRPDLVVVQNDPWNIPAYAKEIGQTPMVAVMPVDGKNCRGRALNGLDHAIWWTEFGRIEAERGGYTGPSTVIPLGVDLAMYTPRDKARVRRAIGPEIPEEAFIVGNVNRNQPRKRLDLMLQYFYEWIERDRIDDAYLYLHICPTGDKGYDLENLAAYYGGEKRKRLILVQPEIGQGDPEERLAMSYSAFDIQASTTQGEGWGLTTLEGMACGVPQLVPKWSALGEWATAAHMIPVASEYCVTPGNGIDVIGAIPQKDAFVQALHDAYHHVEERKEMSRHGIALAHEDRFRWQNIGQRYTEVFDAVLASKTAMGA